jgi:hypothetical protein
MTKKEQETYVKLALNEIETACRDAKEAAAKYGQGEENYAFEVGYLNSRINLTVAILKATLEK